MSKKLLIINPGSTSTKLAVYQDEEKLFQTSITHSAEEIAKHPRVVDQEEMRTKLITDFLYENGLEPKDFDSVMARGGLVTGLKAGGYLVNEDLVSALKDDRYSSPHASNLGGIIAWNLARIAGGIPAYIYDAVTGVELPEVATITGIPEIVRNGNCHVLNSHANAIKYAESIGKKYEDLNLIVAHLGGGISISVHNHGIICDVLGDDEYHFSPERSGSVPLLKFLDLCYSGVYSKDDMKKKVRGKGGMVAHLGTSDCREIEAMIAGGDQHAKLIYEAEALQIAKSIGLLSVTQKGNTDAIILTGGAAYSNILTSNIIEYVKFIAPCKVLPGEQEMEALALGCLRLLDGQEKANIYTLPLD